jgi:flagellar biosynthesis/type III secretory pathway protein FliH
VKEVKEAMETLKYISADDEIRAMADLRQKTINDRNSELTVAKEEGIAIGKAEGKEEGITEGEQKKAMEMALGLLRAGVDINII